MKCNGPLHGWFSSDKASGKGRRVVFRSSEAFVDLHVDVPCGKCLGCKLERSREWAVRCVHEAQMWRSNVFVTLTYRSECEGVFCESLHPGDSHLPQVNGLPTLRPRDFRNFMKRLRHEVPGVRFLQAGEYGKKGRCHHHALLFNCDFDDKYPVVERKFGMLYRSPTLERLWPFGFSSIASVAFESAAYVARYTLKKVNGDEAEAFYAGREPEYMTMSRRPGIGAKWLEKYMSDVYPRGVVVTRGGVRSMPPRFYDEAYKRFDAAGYESLKRSRVMATGTEAYKEENSDVRGAVKEEVTRRRVVDFLERSL